MMKGSITTSSLQQNSLEVSGDRGAGGLGQVDHVLSVGCGGLGGLLSVPDGLHLSVVGADLILGGLVDLVSVSSPVNASNQCSPSAGLDEGRDTDGFCKGWHPVSE
eukprot:TRINITY_DN5712_c0_g1_i1.p1 TRINITY_DN5712_c0_g1~~TRINITY_DN5712_c0_g1_i1.p1  ORF type:complete len:106 (-),score=27.20 TRINITY_DN5712_c0_g1_i1:19-336(-)